MAGWYLKPPEPRPISRFSHVLPGDQDFTNAGRPLVAVSPDGSNIVYVANTQLYLRSMDELEAHPIPGTDETPTNPFFSPDGQSVGYWSQTDQQLKTIAISGGAPVKLCDVATNPFGVSWSEDDMIVWGEPGGVMWVSANGGTPETLVLNEEGQVHGPQALPDGKSVLFTLTSATGLGRWDEAQIVVQSLDTGEQKELLSGGSDARYVPTGHLAYALEDGLFAVPFDLASLEVTGGPVSIVEGMARAPGAQTGTGHFSFSTDGSLVYVVGAGTSTANGTLTLADRNGGVEPLNVPPAQYLTPRISPDGTQLAVQTPEGEGQVWVYDLSGNSAIRQLTREGTNSRPIWTPDGERLTFASDRDGTTGIWWQSADGSGVAEPLTNAEEGVRHWPESWSPDGRTLSFQAIGSDGEREIWTLSLDGEAAPEVFYSMPGSLPAGSVFSPDGNWLAYYSSESGPNQVYVQPVPATGVKYQLTQNGGVFPLWSPDGSELFYRRVFQAGAGARRIIGIDVSTNGAVTVTNEQALPIQGFLAFGTYRSYDIMPDGEQFVVIIPADQTETSESARPQINIVLNWFEELKERVPVP